MSKKVRKKKKKVPLTREQKAKIKEERRLERIRKNYNRAIKKMFVTIGFDHIPSNGTNIELNNRTVEIDNIFVYKNIIICSEDTTTTSDIGRHLLKKKEAAQTIDVEKVKFIKLLKTLFPIETKGLSSYVDSRIIIKHLYFSKFKTGKPSDALKRYDPLKVIEPSMYEYFKLLMNSLEKTARFEIFRYLELKNNDIGPRSSGSSNEDFSQPIICPKEFTGYNDKVQIASFMMTPEFLMKNSYVLRKDNWQDKSEVYQRLIKPKRIRTVRKHVAEKKSAFINNIIVGLPKSTKITRIFVNKQNQDDFEQITDFDQIDETQKYTITLPDEFNSICIIDGQHRVYSHFEGTDIYEDKIKDLRGLLHLLVTGIIFPDDMTETEIMNYQSDLFVDINKNAKPIPPDVILHIETHRTPFLDSSIARKVLEYLNEKENGVFKNLLEISSLEKAQIKTASIIKFALRHLVTITPKSPKGSMINLYDKEKRDKLLKDEKLEDLNDYVSFVGDYLDMYFKALRASKNSDWYGEYNKIRKVMSLNGFVISLNTLISRNREIYDFDYFKSEFDKLKIDFSNDQFPYGSSKYNAFSKDICKSIFQCKEGYEDIGDGVCRLIVKTTEEITEETDTTEN